MATRIAVDVRSLAAPHSGIGRYTERLLRHLIPLMQRDDVDWYLYSDRPISVEFGPSDGIEIRTFATHNRIFGLLRSQLVFSRWAKRDDIDVFWSPRHHLPLFMDPSVKTVLTIHDLVWKDFPETMQTSNRVLEHILMPASLRVADRVIAVSKATANGIAQAYPQYDKKVSVIYEAADHYTNVVGPSYPFEYFLFVGTIEPRKNLVNVLAAIQQVLPLIPQHFVFIGGSGWGQDPRKAVSEANQSYQARYHFLGAVSDQVLHSHYAGATGHIMPSLWEGFGLPALEAMQYGIPVIVSHGSAFPEVVGAAGLYVNPGSVNEISDAIIKLANDLSTRRVLAEKAIEQSDKFSWEKAAIETRALLLDVQV